MRAEGLTDLANGAIGALDPVAGRARDDAETIGAQPAKLREEFLGESAGERLRKAGLSDVAERQDGEPLFVARVDEDRLAAGAVDAFDACDEAVTAAMQRFDEARAVGVVAEHRAEPLHGGIQPVLEVHERAVRPETIAQLVARQQLARMLEHQSQHGERLILQPEPDAVLSELTRP